MQARPLLGQSFLRDGRPIRLGQPLWNSPTQANPNPWGTPLNTTGTTGITSSPQPGTYGAPTNQYSWNQAGGGPGSIQPPAGFEGPTNIFVNTIEPTELKPFPGANVRISLLDVNWNVVQSNIASGVTDQNGQYSVQYQAPAPAQRYFFRATVSPGTGQDFPTIEGTFPARTAVAASAGTNQPESMKADFVVCPKGTDELVCDIAAVQLSKGTAYNQFVFAAGAPDSRSAAGSFNNERLKAHWDIFDRWAGNRDFLPKEWPEIVTKFEQMWGVWAKVPWPRKMIKDLFERCAKNVKLYKDFTVYDQNFYSTRYSDFFPKTDEEIRRIIATKSLNNIPDIFICMENLIKKKIKSEEKSMQKWRIIGLAANMLFLWKYYRQRHLPDGFSDQTIFKCHGLFKVHDGLRGVCGAMLDRRRGRFYLYLSCAVRPVVHGNFVHGRIL